MLLQCSGKYDDGVGGVLGVERRQQGRAARGGVHRAWSSSALRGHGTQHVGRDPLLVSGRRAAPLIYKQRGGVELGSGAHGVGSTWGPSGSKGSASSWAFGAGAEDYSCPSQGHSRHPGGGEAKPAQI